MSLGQRVGVLGATGAVGQEFLKLFENRKFPISELRLFASKRSAGTKVEFQGQTLLMQSLDSDLLRDLDVVFMSAGANRSREWAPIAINSGAFVVDNSSAFRMNPGVPLVIPEVNWSDVQPEHKLVANPNCCAIILLMAVAPLIQLAPIDRLIVSTYQSASGGGAALMQDLWDQTTDYLEDRPVTPKVSPHPYAFNLFSHNTPINENGENEEEVKVIEESRKILSNPNLKINVTCVRVPILRAHSESITIEFDTLAPDLDDVRSILGASPGIRLVDDHEKNHFPMPVESTGQDNVLVGRIRKDPSNPNAICMFVSGDQLLKGAALNAIQIAEYAIESGFLV